VRDELSAKRLEVLKETAPRISRVAFVWNPEHADNELDGAKRASAAHGIALQTVRFARAAVSIMLSMPPRRRGIDAIYLVSSRQTVAN
jgi:putative ABC transport system substrate-binding protein